jgi:hypothetical protein
LICYQNCVKKTSLHTGIETLLECVTSITQLKGGFLVVTDFVTLMDCRNHGAT